MSVADTSAPATVSRGMARPEKPARPVVIATTAPRLPPAEMPRISGLAIGLRNSPCITAPQAASEAPTRSAASTRGRRSDRMIVAACGSGAGVQRRPASCRSTRRSCTGAVLTAPMLTARTMAATSAMASPAMSPVVRAFMVSCRAYRNASGYA